MRRGYAVLCLCLQALLSGCAAIWVSTPQTFDERLADGIAAVSAVRTTTTALFREGQISAEDAQQVQSRADNAREGLDVAKGLHATDPDAGNVRLTAVGAALQDLQTYLNSKRPLPSSPIYCC